MIITKENFEEVMKSPKPVLIRFSVESGCKFCDQYKPIWDAFVASHQEILCCEITKATLATPPSDLENTFDVKSYPTTVSVINGQVIKKETGVQTPEKLLNMLKTLGNISDEEIMTIRIDLNIEIAKQEKVLFELKARMIRINTEIEARQRFFNQQSTNPPPISPERQALMEHLNAVKSTNKECNDKCEDLCKDKGCESNCVEWCEHIKLHN